MVGGRLLFQVPHRCASTVDGSVTFKPISYSPAGSVFIATVPVLGFSLNVLGTQLHRAENTQPFGGRAPFLSALPHERGGI